MKISHTLLAMFLLPKKNKGPEEKEVCNLTNMPHLSVVLLHICFVLLKRKEKEALSSTDMNANYYPFLQYRV